MLFNSYEFIFLFFPAVVAAYVFSVRFGPQWRRLVLLVASGFFYAWWNIELIPLLAGSIIVNFVIGREIGRCVKRSRAQHADWFVALAVTLNLAALAFFKYSGFLTENLNAAVGTAFAVRKFVLPLGISFFTFEQIGFIVDQRRGHDYDLDLVSYAVFVAFFPRLVAGPILRYNEIVPQIDDHAKSRPIVENIAVGLTIFFIGLAKKAIIADGIAPFASSVFDQAAQGHSVDFFVAWGGALAYTLQLYFDFSGYSDMAVGAARCFGIRLPMNFSSPYKASNIVDFWRRWHITLSRFLRDYLYIPLGGNRHGVLRRYSNLLVTMLLGGLWHGANWTFVAWGGLHGAYLIVNHAWIAIAGSSPALRQVRRTRAWAAISFLLTFVAVIIGWIFFRSRNTATAFNLLGGMFGRHGASVPEGLAFALRPIHGLLTRSGIGFSLDSGSHFIQTWLWVATGMAIVLLLPNTYEIMASSAPVLEIGDKVSSGERMKPPSRLAWSPSWPWAVTLGTLAFLGTISITRVSEFLYWQF